MHLKSLTVKGFKSFASATTFNFEPGITVVVGPNGSGKSNVVDAVAWVMGEQGAKTLRGGKMEDVIFAGTAGRAPLGRAEVCLTVDNSDGALPIDYTEVTISRTLFRSGGSEYAINGQECRLLDIQELLSDSGIGREMHVIVGQGQLDAVLGANPEERRGFIEEAAGVLKHRKRKEKALRKLESMSANLTRVQDLAGELRRQLKPLGKQAEVARRAHVIQSDARDSRLRLLADDLLVARSALAKEEIDEALLRDQRSSLDEQLEAARTSEAQLEAVAADSDPAIRKINEVHLRLTALSERYAGLISLAAERAKYASEAQDEQLTIDPDHLDRQGEAAQEQCEALAIEVAALQAVLASAADGRNVAEDALGQANVNDQRQRSEAARRREQLAKLEGDLRSARSRVEAREAEIDRLSGQLVQARQRVTPLAAHLAELESAESESDELVLAPIVQARETAQVDRDRIKSELTQAQAASHEADRERAGIAARIEALRMSLANGGGSGALDSSGVPLIGVVADFLRVADGWQGAIEAALHRVGDADAVAVAGTAAAVDALRHLRAQSGGRTSVVIADAVGVALTATRPDLAGVGVWAKDVVSGSANEGSDAVICVVHQLLADVVLVKDLDQAQQLAAIHPHLTVVTAAGDVLGRFVATGGDGAASRLQLIAAVDAADERQWVVQMQCDQLDHRVSELDQAFAKARSAHQQLTDRVQEVSKSASAHLAALTLASSQLTSAQAEADRIEKGLTQAKTAHVGDIDSVQAAAAKLDQHAGGGEQSEADVGVSPEELEALRTFLEQARASEIDARLAVRTAEERMDSYRTRANELREAANAERDARERARQQRERRKRQGAAAIAVLEVAQQAAAILNEALARSDQERQTADEQRRNREAQLARLRTAIRELASQIDKLTTDVHRDEIARAEQRLRVEAFESKAMEEFGIDSEQLICEYGPGVLVPPSARVLGDEYDIEAPDPQPYPFVRAAQEQRLRAAEKSMALLGRVNPLALEEFTAMEERHTFLNTQLEDIKASRKDLLDIIDEVDQRIQQVFAQAFADVQRQFCDVFPRLFPGGEGRLVLTDPGDLLTTGIEIEARPAGKKVKRLSLLSGGERSLTGIAFLVSLFKARPSPFYLLDEVEAALDEVNLGRVINLLEDLRATSQILIITHQKKTMEIADALYGVTMREGVSQVISQRMRELQTV